MKTKYPSAMTTSLRLLAPVCAFLVLSVSCLGGTARLAGTGLSAEFDAKTGALLKLGTLAIASAGGHFSAYDFARKKPVPLAANMVSSRAGRVSIRCAGDQLVCNATCVISKGSLHIRGTLTNLTGLDRAIALSYTIPFRAKDLRFSPSLNTPVPVGAKRSGEGSVYPIAAMCGKDFGLAIAIPPTAPCTFKLIGSAEGLTLRMYLGLSPDTRRLPNAAHFSLMIYPCDPRWGFRDAARRYYAAFPEYYTHHARGDGLWLFQSVNPPNLGDFLYDETWPNPKFEETLARDDRAGVLSFPYTIVGQREIKHLKSLPGSYEEAMAEYDRWTPDRSFAPSKESTAASDDTFLREEVESSAIKDKAGRYQIKIRNTDWGGDSVTFVMNPNPDLLTGGGTMAMVREWLAAYPAADGIYVDSLGSAWCGKINFRHDHFPYARYPLTFDADGNVALHNQISHYEFLETLRSELHRRGKLLMANGVYLYSAKEPEYADVTETGRFFPAALLDAAGSESGVTPSIARWEFFRTAMGPKPYLLLNYYWQDKAKVEDYFNQALAFGVFATNSSGLGRTYWTDPKGYPRDKKLYDWYVPLVRQLSKAGWQPVTYAASPTPGVHCERYGRSCFTIYNHGPEARECVLLVETKPLGLTRNARVEQLSGGGPPGVNRRASAITVRVKLGIKRTAVIRVVSR